jgi:hypothetical protein
MQWAVVGDYKKLRKGTIRFVMSVCPSVPMEQLGSHWTDFHEHFYFIVLENMSIKYKFLYNLTRLAGS